MKAMIFTSYGTPDVLELVEIPRPIPAPNELLVEVVATAVNRADAHVLSGMLRFSTGLLKPKHPVLGSDVAGRVAAVGQDVTQFRVGDAVYGDLSGVGRGGFAEFVTAPESVFAPMPANLTFAEAAAVPMTAVTALQGLRDRGRIQPGQQVLINGASGGVGTFAVQIAKALGAEVTAVASTRNLALISHLGADHTIDYTQEDFASGARRYDLIFDTVGNRSLSEIRRALTPRGTFVTTAFLPGILLMGPWLARSEGKRFVNLMAKPRQADLLVLTEWLEAGTAVAVIDHCTPLPDLPDALNHLRSGHARGKVIVAIQPELAGQTVAGGRTAVGV